MTALDDALREGLPQIRVDVPAIEAAQARVVRVAARKRTARRLIVAGTTASVVAAIVVAAPVVARRSTRVEVITPPASVQTSTTVTTSGEITPAGSSTGAAFVPRRDGAPQRGPSGSSDPSTARQAVATTTTTEAATATRGTEGCVVKGYDDSGVNLKEDGSPGGVSAGREPSCTYTATKPGGYVAKGKWRIEIRRGPYDIVVSSANGDATCASVGFIRPDDVVTVSVLGGVETRDDPGFVSTGPDHFC
jgi:hypothetical protein